MFSQSDVVERKIYRVVRAVASLDVARFIHFIVLIDESEFSPNQVCWNCYVKKAFSGSPIKSNSTMLAGISGK